MIFVPEYNSSMCAYIYNTDIIRVYQSKPRVNSTINYRDYYIKSSYIYNNGSTSFGQYATLPVCIEDTRITTDVYYRNDLPGILIIFLTFVLICFWTPWRLLLRMFRRYQ